MLRGMSYGSRKVYDILSREVRDAVPPIRALRTRGDGSPRSKAGKIVYYVGLGVWALTPGVVPATSGSLYLWRKSRRIVRRLRSRRGNTEDSSGGGLRGSESNLKKIADKGV